jgi:hypothetical protein
MMLCTVSNTDSYDTLGKDGGLGDIKFKSTILLDDVLEYITHTHTRTHTHTHTRHHPQNV